MILPIWRQFGSGVYVAAPGGTDSSQTQWVQLVRVVHTGTWGDAALVAPPTITSP